MSSTVSWRRAEASMIPVAYFGLGGEEVGEGQRVVDVGRRLGVLAPLHPVLVRSKCRGFQNE